MKERFTKIQTNYILTCFPLNKRFKKLPYKEINELPYNTRRVFLIVEAL